MRKPGCVEEHAASIGIHEPPGELDWQEEDPTCRRLHQLISTLCMGQSIGMTISDFLSPPRIAGYKAATSDKRDRPPGNCVHFCVYLLGSSYVVELEATAAVSHPP